MHLIHSVQMEIMKVKDTREMAKSLQGSYFLHNIHGVAWVTKTLPCVGCGPALEP